MNEETKHNYSAKCPTHNLSGKFVPPVKTDYQRKKQIVTFKCPKGHEFVIEYDLK